MSLLVKLYHNKQVIHLAGIALVPAAIMAGLALFTALPAAALGGSPSSPNLIHPPAEFSAALPGHLLQFHTPQASPQALEVLHSFSGTDGGSPNSLLQSSSGLLYGSTAIGGDTSACPSDGCGVLFTLDTNGTFANLHTFHATDGYIPTGLIESSPGNFYGTTEAGGQPSGGGAGTLFRITSAGTLTSLYAFVGGFSCCDGASPVGHPILASDGKFYGLTGAGGAYRDTDHPGGFGTFYQYDPDSNVLSILHSFNIADNNGIFPSGSLVQGRDGFFYGVARESGTGGAGTIYRLDTAGNLTLLHAISDSAEPLAGLIQASDGYFYGTTDGGAGAGTIFRIDSAGNYNVVNRFDGGDGYRPHWGLLQATDGWLYGTTPQGGLLDFQGGSLFRLETSGNHLSVLHSFTTTDPVTGFIPNDDLIQATDTFIYGVAGIGGANHHGTIFRFDPALPGPVASVMVDPGVIITPGNATGTVTLSSPAPKGGQLVGLRAGSFNVIVPQTVSVPAGQTQATFSVQALQVVQPEDVRLYAFVDGEGTRTVFTILPPGSPSPTPTWTATPTATHTPLPPTPTPTATSTPPQDKYRVFLPVTDK